MSCDLLLINSTKERYVNFSTAASGTQVNRTSFNIRDRDTTIY